ncbi:CAP domain-containing protein [Galbibacter pacificus]|uniref:CAP domain-containing protein n=1 Tax=Galbibacter pacificus TaxID=2996052 RepID=A0ABT6FUQ3_9FLAO|nr:CAP domain-containing protein [Galbibacter pacificus]MDG3583530.1 CAP domain-containing protein [Galbibacter pacificus]MDG3586994.1 CAP domain-containing protein [Galbibacter pacificus]
MNAPTKAMVVILLLVSYSSFYSCSPDEIETVDELNAENAVTYIKIEDEVLNLINEYRIGKNLSPLEKLNIISQEAKVHTEHMIAEDEICHHFFADREHNLHYNADAVAVGENVGYGYHTAKGIVEAWLESESHKKNIEGNYTAMGISAIQNKKGDYFYTNIFVRR